MVTAIWALHILLTILLVLVVLIQGGENVDITAAFGGVSQAAFGPRGTVTTLAKVTWVLGFLFVCTSVTLSIWATRKGSGSIMEHAPTKSAPVSKSPAPAKK